MPAVVVGGAIAGIGAIGAAAIGSSAQSKASKQAVQATTNATTQNNALTRDIYEQNKGVLAPYVQSGYGANQQINALLGIPANNNNAGVGYIGTQPNALAPQPSAQQAFANYQNSTGYQFRIDQGMKSIGANWLGRGLGKSGAAAKSAMTFGQGIASDEFGNYLGALGNQQNVGLSAGNALAGVGTNYAGQVANQNNANASVIANAALQRGQSTADMVGGVANAFGRIGSALSSYHGGNRNSYGIAGAGGIY